MSLRDVFSVLDATADSDAVSQTLSKRHSNVSANVYASGFAALASLTYFDILCPQQPGRNAPLSALPVVCNGHTGVFIPNNIRHGPPFLVFDSIRRWNPARYRHRMRVWAERPTAYIVGIFRVERLDRARDEDSIAGVGKSKGTVKFGGRSSAA
ncbi:hypothetical protein B0H12DRAFT_1077025 [Mycena haematopus]|nr:hypothetical protein B0H12DRAFT_1077025 [Mycena haematopus]